MKKITILALLLITITSVQAQKQEIKKAENALKSGNISDAFYFLEQAQQIFAAADSETRAHYYVVEAEMHLANKQMDKSRLEAISNSMQTAAKYELSSSLQKRITNIKSELKNLTAKAADGEFRKKNFSDAAALYRVAYQATKDTIHFYNAAKSHLLAKEYEEAFSSYRRIFEMGFNGSRIRYVATNVKSGEKEAFSSAHMRNIAISERTHKKPEVVRSGAKTRELLRGMTISSIHINKNSEAEALLDKALANSPNDKIISEQVFHLYGQIGATDKYNAMMDLLIKESPNDPNMYYNFGVSSAQSNHLDKAKELYKKALSLEPNHVNAKINLSSIILDQETSILEEMNGLGMNEADDKRYEELKAKRNILYHEALPYLESIVELQPKNMDVVKTLLNIYSKIGQDSKYSVLKQRLDD